MENTKKETFSLEIKNILEKIIIKNTKLSPTTLKACDVIESDTLYELLEKLKDQKTFSGLGKMSKNEIKKIVKYYKVVLNERLQPIMFVEKNK